MESDNNKSDDDDQESVSKQIKEYYQKYAQSKQLPKYFSGSSLTYMPKIVPDETVQIPEIVVDETRSETLVPDKPQTDSEEVAEPKVISPASSAASVRKLEWDNGADIGYNNCNKSILHKSLSLPILTSLEVEQVVVEKPVEPKLASQVITVISYSSSSDDSEKKVQASSSSPSLPTNPPQGQSSSSSKITGSSSSNSATHSSSNFNTLAYLKNKIGSPDAESTPKNDEVTKAKSDSKSTPFVPKSDQRKNQVRNKVIKLCLTKPITVECLDNCKKVSTDKKIQTTFIDASSKSVQTSLSRSESPVVNPTKSPRDNQSVIIINRENDKQSSDAATRCDSFEYYQEAKSDTETPVLGQLISKKQSETLKRDVDKSVEILQKLLKSKKYDPATKKRYIRKIVKKIIDSEYIEDSTTTSSEVFIPKPAVSNLSVETFRDEFLPVEPKKRSVFTTQSSTCDSSNKIESSSSYQSWKENKTLSERLLEQQGQGDHLIKFAMNERQNQLCWINDEIKHLTKLKGLLQKDRLNNVQKTTTVYMVSQKHNSVTSSGSTSSKDYPVRNYVIETELTEGSSSERIDFNLFDNKGKKNYHVSEVVGGKVDGSGGLVGDIQVVSDEKTTNIKVKARRAENGRKPILVGEGKYDTYPKSKQEIKEKLCCCGTKKCHESDVVCTKQYSFEVPLTCTKSLLAKQVDEILQKYTQSHDCQPDGVCTKDRTTQKLPVDKKSGCQCHNTVRSTEHSVTCPRKTNISPERVQCIHRTNEGSKQSVGCQCNRKHKKVTLGDVQCLVCCKNRKISDSSEVGGIRSCLCDKEKREGTECKGTCCKCGDRERGSVGSRGSDGQVSEIAYRVQPSGSADLRRITGPSNRLLLSESENYSSGQPPTYVDALGSIGRRSLSSGQGSGTPIDGEIKLYHVSSGSGILREALDSDKFTSGRTASPETRSLDSDKVSGRSGQQSPSKRRSLNSRKSSMSKTSSLEARSIDSRGRGSKKSSNIDSRSTGSKKHRTISRSKDSSDYEKYSDGSRTKPQNTDTASLSSKKSGSSNYSDARTQPLGTRSRSVDLEEGPTRQLTGSRTSNPERFGSDGTRTKHQTTERGSLTSRKSGSSNYSDARTQPLGVRSRSKDFEDRIASRIPGPEKFGGVRSRTENGSLGSRKSGSNDYSDLRTQPLGTRSRSIELGEGRSRQLTGSRAFSSGNTKYAESDGVGVQPPSTGSKSTDIREDGVGGGASRSLGSKTATQPPDTRSKSIDLEGETKQSTEGRTSSSERFNGDQYSDRKKSSSKESDKHRTRQSFTGSKSSGSERFGETGSYHSGTREQRSSGAETRSVESGRHAQLPGNTGSHRSGSHDSGSQPKQSKSDIKGYQNDVRQQETYRSSRTSDSESKSSGSEKHGSNGSSRGETQYRGSDNLPIERRSADNGDIHHQNYRKQSDERRAVHRNPCGCLPCPCMMGEAPPIISQRVEESEKYSSSSRSSELGQVPLTSSLLNSDKFRNIDTYGGARKETVDKSSCTCPPCPCMTGETVQESTKYYDKSSEVGPVTSMPFDPEKYSGSDEISSDNEVESELTYKKSCTCACATNNKLPADRAPTSFKTIQCKCTRCSQRLQVERYSSLKDEEVLQAAHLPCPCITATQTTTLSSKGVQCNCTCYSQGLQAKDSCPCCSAEMQTEIQLTGEKMLQAAPDLRDHKLQTERTRTEHAKAQTTAMSSKRIQCNCTCCTQGLQAKGSCPCCSTEIQTELNLTGEKMLQTAPDLKDHKSQTEDAHNEHVKAQTDYQNQDKNTQTLTVDDSYSYLTPSSSETDSSSSESSTSSISLHSCICCKRKNVTEKNLNTLRRKLSDQTYPLCRACYRHNRGGVFSPTPYTAPGYVCNCYTMVQTKTLYEIKKTINELNELNDEYCTCTDIKNRTNAKYCKHCKCKLEKTTRSGKGIAYMLTLEDATPQKERKKKKRKSLEEIKIKIPVPHKKKHKEKENNKKKRKQEKEQNGHAIETTSSTEVQKARASYSVQEYLVKNRPDFVESAEERRRIVQDVRTQREEMSDVKKLQFLQNYCQEQCEKRSKRLFSAKEMKEITKRNYQKLPEVQQKLVDNKEKQIRQASRLMADTFNRKLRENVLKGKRNLSVDVNVINL